MLVRWGVYYRVQLLPHGSIEEDNACSFISHTHTHVRTHILTGMVAAAIKIFNHNLNNFKWSVPVSMTHSNPSLHKKHNLIRHHVYQQHQSSYVFLCTYVQCHMAAKNIVKWLPKVIEPPWGMVSFQSSRSIVSWILDLMGVYIPYAQYSRVSFTYL